MKYFPYIVTAIVFLGLGYLIFHSDHTPHEQELKRKNDLLEHDKQQLVRFAENTKIEVEGMSAKINELKNENRQSTSREQNTQRKLDLQRNSPVVHLTDVQLQRAADSLSLIYKTAKRY